MKNPEVLHTKVTLSYGLMQVCELDEANIPGPGNGKLSYTIYECRKFPASVSDGLVLVRSLCLPSSSALVRIRGDEGYGGLWQASHHSRVLYHLGKAYDELNDIDYSHFPDHDLCHRYTCLQCVLVPDIWTCSAWLCLRAEHLHLGDWAFHSSWSCCNWDICR